MSALLPEPPSLLKVRYQQLKTRIREMDALCRQERKRFHDEKAELTARLDAAMAMNARLTAELESKQTTSRPLTF